MKITKNESGYVFSEITNEEMEVFRNSLAGEVDCLTALRRPNLQKPLETAKRLSEQLEAAEDG